MESRAHCNPLSIVFPKYGNCCDGVTQPQALAGTTTRVSRVDLWAGNPYQRSEPLIMHVWPFWLPSLFDSDWVLGIDGFRLTQLKHGSWSPNWSRIGVPTEPWWNRTTIQTIFHGISSLSSPTSHCCIFHVAKISREGWSSFENNPCADCATEYFEHYTRQIPLWYRFPPSYSTILHILHLRNHNVRGRMPGGVSGDQKTNFEKVSYPAPIVPSILLTAKDFESSWRGRSNGLTCLTHLTWPFSKLLCSTL